MADDNSGVFNFTAPVLMFHPNLFKAKKFRDPKTGRESGEEKFSANLGLRLDHPDLPEAKKLAGIIAKAGFPGRAFNTLAFPFKNGDKLADEAAARVAAKIKGARPAEYNRGLVIIPARTKFPPRLSAIVNGKVVDFEDLEAAYTMRDKFFFGAEVFAQINFVCHEVGNNPPGINAYLNMVLATGKGTRIGGFTSAADVFKGYAGSLSAEDPTVAAGDDEIPV